MSLIFAESFELQDPGAGTPPTGRWTKSGGVKVDAGAASIHGRYFRCSGSSDGTITRNLAVAEQDDLLIVGFRIRTTSTNGPTFLSLGGASLSTHLTLVLTTAFPLGIRVIAGDGVDTTIPSLIASGVWHYIEVKCRLHNTTGSVELRVNEQSVFSASNVDTKGAAGDADTVFTRVAFHSVTHFNSPFFDDITICNEQGAVNNDFLGDCTVQGLFADGNGNSSQLVGSDGNSTDNYLLVNETTVDDTDYVQSSVDNNKDTYAYADFTANPGDEIAGVQVWARAQKSDAGSRSLALVARSGGSETDSADKTLALTTWEWHNHVYETKPGGGDWAASDVNAAEFGYKARP